MSHIRRKQARQSTGARDILARVFELRCDISAETAAALDDHFGENQSCQWTLVQLRPESPVELIGYFETPEAARADFSALREVVTASLPDEPAITEIEDRQWQDAYKQFLQPWSHRDLHWVPEWMRGEWAEPQGEHTLYFDAGMAFGTGAHETTRLMARRLLDDRDYTTTAADARDAVDAGDAGGALAKRRVIDAGCGSGILAISAHVLGYREIFGFDSDTEAVRVSRENLSLNGLPGDAIDFAHAGLEGGLDGHAADLLLANIISEVLEIYAANLVRATAPGGTLALSGILAKEVERVRSTFACTAEKLWQAAPETIDSRTDGDWADLCLVRRR